MTYPEYHHAMMEAGDTDPAYPCLRYVCRRFELNREQQYWLAFLYATCYCGPTVFYIYNEFPDYENVDVGRLQRWWIANKHRLIFQSDRMRIKTQNLFVPCFESYKATLGGLSQHAAFYALKHLTPEATYRACYEHFSSIKYFGRFSMFNYLDAVHHLTGLSLQPDTLNLAEADSCRNGLVFAINQLGLLRHQTKWPLLTAKQLSYLQSRLPEVFHQACEVWPNTTYFHLETTLCAYKKYRLGKRYVGYYIDRQAKEIEGMQIRVPGGVDWSVLWDFRREYFAPEWLKEVQQ